jgi:hypothetical protein
MNYIQLDWPTYLANAELWQRISTEMNITLHIG